MLLETQARTLDTEFLAGIRGMIPTIGLSLDAYEERDLQRERGSFHSDAVASLEMFTRGYNDQIGECIRSFSRGKEGLIGDDHFMLIPVYTHGFRTNIYRQSFRSFGVQEVFSDTDLGWILSSKVQIGGRARNIWLANLAYQNSEVWSVTHNRYPAVNPGLVVCQLQAARLTTEDPEIVDAHSRLITSVSWEHFLLEVMSTYTVSAGIDSLYVQKAALNNYYGADPERDARLRMRYDVTPYRYGYDKRKYLHVSSLDFDFRDETPR